MNDHDFCRLDCAIAQKDAKAQHIDPKGISITETTTFSANRTFFVQWREGDRLHGMDISACCKWNARSSALHHLTVRSRRAA